MTALSPPLTHIRFDEQGRPWLEGTTIKVMEVVLNHLANGWSPEEIFLHQDRRIPLAKIHAALSYYFDNQAAFDEQIRYDLEGHERSRKSAMDSPFRRRMREAGKLP